MNNKQKNERHKRRVHHHIEAARKKADALKQAKAEAKRRKSGKKGIAAAMNKSGYMPDGKGGWKAIEKSRAVSK